jgi:hypothetical protein
LILDDMELIVERLHVRIQLSFQVAGQVSQILVRERDDRTRSNIRWVYLSRLYWL